MARVAPILAALAALSLAGGAPAFAGCGNLSACGGNGGRGGSSLQSGPNVFVPPIAMQQIETAAPPIAAPNGPPLPSASAGDATPGPTVAGPLSSVADLDGGAEKWNYIAPGATVDKLPPQPVTDVVAAHPVTQSQPQPAKTEIAVGAHLSMEVPAQTIRSKGVPGIDQASTGGGNRSLWFAPDNGH